MKQILLVHCSPHGKATHGFRLASDLVGQLQLKNKGCEVIERDLVAHPLPPLAPAYAEALLAMQLSDPALAISEQLIGELERSDCLVLVTPMHNFTVPAALKLWIDYVLRIGRTFVSTPEGKLGLLADRPTYVVVSSGGFHKGEQARQPDFLTPYLKVVLRTIGIHHVEFISLQGLVFGEDCVAQTLGEARHKLSLDYLVQLPETAPTVKA
ncbi:NAD(P)H-dependent oxidoreductase (plasmid) [Pseudomonas luteola]|uniref:FMN-dependent NADH-azoreductase n=1 Tax=Pseudomonas luteola TaxID=47886 RepID=UPI003D9FC1CA